MKRKGILGFLVFVLLFASCDKAEILEKRLIGRWYVSVYQKTVFNGNEPVLDQILTYGSAGNITFNSNGTGLYEFVYDLKEGSFGYSGSFEWDNNAESVSIREASGTKVFKVAKNSKSEMVFERTVKPFYFSDGEIGVTYTMEETFTLKK